MWLVIWGIFAVFITVFVGWTMLVLFQQKKAWSAFAKRHKLKYEPGTFMGSPMITGKFNDRPFSLYTGVQQTDDIRGQRYVTIIEFQIGQGMPTGAAIATRDFAGFIEGLIFDRSYEPALAEWQKDYILRTRDEPNLQAYLTKERLQVLHSLFSMKGAAALFFFDELEAVLRIETSDPLKDEAHLDKIVKRISAAIERLTPTEKEKKTFKKLLEEEKERRRRAEAQIEEPEDEDEDDIDLKALGLDEDEDDDDEEEIIIIKKKPKKKKKKAASAKSKKKKPDQSASEE